MFKLGLILSLLLVLTGCLPQAKQQSCGQGNVFNSTSRTCVPVTSGGQTSGVSIAGRNPALSNFTVSAVSTTTLNFSVSINNPLNQGYEIRWRLYSPTGTLSPSLATPTVGAVAFTPQNAFAGVSGLWTLAAEIVSIPSNVLITQTQWFITAIPQATPTLTKVAGSPLSVSTSPSATSYGVTVSNPGSQSAVVVWYYNGVQETSVMAANGSTSFASSKQFFSLTNNITNDNPPLLTGPASIRAELRQGSVSGAIFDQVEWTVFVNPPNFASITAVSPDPTATLIALNSVSLQNQGIRSGSSFLTATDICGYVNPLCQSNNSFCVDVNSHLGSTGVAGNVQVRFFRNGATGTLIAQKTVVSSGEKVCLGKITGAPSFFMSLANPNVGEFQTVVAVVVDNNQSVGTINWPVSVRPTNTPPIASKQSPAESTTPSNHLVGTAQTYTVSVQDDDHPNAALHSYQWKFENTLLNGTNFFPGTTVVTPNCQGVGMTSCTFTIPTYNLAGRLDPELNVNQVYSVTVQATDPGISTPSYSAAPLSSNTLSWSVKPFAIGTVPSATAPSIAAPGASTCTPYYATDVCNPGATTPNSYIALATSPTTPLPVNGSGQYTTALAESTNIVFNMLVNDADRDDYSITIECVPSGATVCPAIPMIHSSNVTRVNDSFGNRIAINYTISQSTIVGAASGAVTYRVTVNDRTNYFAAVASVLEIATNKTATRDFVVNTINNLNPPPQLAAGAVQTPAIGSTSDVVVGYPFTIDPGVIVDNSTSDGSTISYQWQVSKNGGATWVNIIGSNQRVLKWTPGINSVNDSLQLRLCLGDDGFGNAVSSCGTGGGATVGVWNVNPRINSLLAASGNTTGDVATHVIKDGTRQEMYMAYPINGSPSYIVVEKYQFNVDSDLELVKTMRFTTESSSGASYPATKLSLESKSVTTGGKTYRGLYVSYVTQQTVPGPVNPRMRVRYLDITDTDDLMFNYDSIYNSQCVDSVTKIYNIGCVNPYTVVMDASRTVTFSNFNPTGFPAGSFIAINGVKLYSVAGGTYSNFDGLPATGLGWNITSGGRCEFTGHTYLVTPTAQQLAYIVGEAYRSCASVFLDRRLNISGTITTDPTFTVDTFSITQMPAMHVDIDYPIAFGRVGDIMIHNNVIAIPYLDNNNTGKLAIAALRMSDAYNYGGLASTDSGTNFAIAPSYLAQSITAESLDLANSYADVGTFDVALVNSLNRLDYHRFTIAATATSASVNLVGGSSRTNVFSTTTAVSKPRIATGLAASNNHVFILAQDQLDVNKELRFARIKIANSTIEIFSPLDSLHVQAKNLKDYRLQADNCVSSNNNGAILAAYTTSNLSLVSALRTPSAGALQTGLLISPDFSLDPALSAGAFDYPVLSSGAATAGISLSKSFTLSGVGQAGAQALENESCSMSAVHSGALRSQLSVVNVKPVAIQATEVQSSPLDGLFQPPFIK